jgi:hypothetical protein
MVCDVHGWGMFSKRGLVAVVPKLKDMVLDVGFVIEGRSEDELPERLAGSCCVANLDPKACLALDDDAGEGGSGSEGEEEGGGGERVARKGGRGVLGATGTGINSSSASAHAHWHHTKNTNGLGLRATGIFLGYVPRCVSTFRPVSTVWGGNGFMCPM